MSALFPPHSFATNPRMPNPYRIIVTAAGGGYLVISLVKVWPLDSMPTRVKHPTVTAVLRQWRCTKPHKVITGVCMPPKPEAIATVYERELLCAYELFDQLINAPVEA